MTAFPCLVDTPTVEQMIDASGYRADLRLDPDANALEIRDGALYAPVGPCDSARVYRTANQNCSSGDQISFGAGAVRWDTTNGRIFSGATGFTLSRTGWWAIGGTFALTPGAAVGTYWILLQATNLAGINAVIGADGSANPGTFSGSTAETLCLNPNAFAFLPAGSTISAQLFISSSVATVNVLGDPTFPSVGANVEAAGCEIWGTCYEGLVIE